MRAGWSSPAREEKDFQDNAIGEGGEALSRVGVRWGEGVRDVGGVGGQQQHHEDFWEMRKSNIGEVRGQLVLGPGGGKTTSVRVSISEEGGEEGARAHTLSRWGCFSYLQTFGSQSSSSSS